MAERAGDFLIYGGVIIDSERARDLSDAIESIRHDAHIGQLDIVKFDRGSLPIDHDGYKTVKEAIIKAAIEHEVVFLTYAILHDVAGDPDTARLYGVNTICFHFDSILYRYGAPGLVLIDRVNNSGGEMDKLLREKFSIGVKNMPYSSEIRLKNILGFHYSAIGQSHFTSLADILIGSLRWAINAHTRNEAEKQPSALALLALMSPLFFRETGRNTVGELGFAFRPKAVTVSKYREKYESLQAFLRKGRIDTEQVIQSSREW
jgi:hypothetical protein